MPPKKKEDAVEEKPEETKTGQLEPLNDREKVRLKELEHMARCGRKIDQPTHAEMKELGELRARNTANQ